MYSELKHSKKLSKRLQRDPKFKAVIYKRNKVYTDIGPGLKEVNCWVDIESIFTNISNFDSEEDLNDVLKENQEDIQQNEIDSYVRDYRERKDGLAKRRLMQLK